MGVFFGKTRSFENWGISLGHSSLNWDIFSHAFRPESRASENISWLTTVDYNKVGAASHFLIFIILYPTWAHGIIVKYIQCIWLIHSFI